MPKRLRKGEICPIHRSKFCCRGGVTIESKRKSRHYDMVAPGVRRYTDGREVCSDAELKRRKDYLLKASPFCCACEQRFDDYREVELAHVESKGTGSWKRDDRFSNLRLLHMSTNRDCGSLNLDEYMTAVRKAGRKFPCEMQ
jgi:hypothetical protein